MAYTAWLYDLARKPVKGKADATLIHGASQVVVDSFGEFRRITGEKMREARQYVEDIDFEGVQDDAKEKLVALCVAIRAFLRTVADFILSLDPRDIPQNMVVPLVVAAFAAFIVAALVYRKKQQQIKHREQYGDNAFPPYAPCNSFETVSALTGKEQPWFFKQCAELVGPVFRLRLPFSKAPMLVAIGDVETAKEILQDPNTVKPEAMYKSIAAVAGGPNIFTSEGIHWKLSRKCLSPAFMKNHLDRMHRVCKEQTEEWIQNRLEPAIQSDNSFDIGEECMHLTISIICRAAFEYHIKDTEAKALMLDIAAVSNEYAVDEIQSPIRKLISSVFSAAPSSDSAASKDRIQSFAKKMLSAYRKRQKSRRQSTAPPPKESLISLISKSTNYESDTHRVADIVMLLLSGQENTAYTLAWILLELARNPAELRHLRDALGGNDDGLAQQMLKDILREGMRLRPVSPGIGIRMIAKDFYLKDKAVVIPQGSLIMFPSMILTRNEVENAEEFRPSRWAEHPDRSFLAFSTGKRNCVGQALALAEITWVLSRLCAKYDFEVELAGKAEFCATLKCVGARLKAHKWSQ